ncbi:MAG TPA: hypothetical protein VH682_25970 [Gemmataceae bacterium]|jgi:hypothetical protein
MKPNTIEMEGTVQEDGTLVLPEKLPLPAGRVRVTVQPVSAMTPAEQFWAGMRAIWAGQEARGHVPREKDEIDAEIRALREEAEEEMRQIEERHRDTQAERGSASSES